MAKTVLVVDDSASLRQSVAYVLSEEGYEINEAEDGAKGLAKAEKEKYSLIVSDVNMPVMDGIEFTKKVRESEMNKYTPIVILTTESQKTKMEEGKSAGATGWIVKPFNAEKLLGVVKKLVE